MAELSMSQVNRAGQRVRRHARGEDVDSEALRLAVDIFDLDFKAGWNQNMNPFLALVSYALAVWEAVMRDTIFLLVYNSIPSELDSCEDFGDDQAAAIKAYVDAERLHADEAGILVVLIGSDSIETVRITHANYFGGPPMTSKYFAGL